MIKFYRYLYILLIISLTLVAAACDAPHSNPIDPQNPEGNYSKLEGYVKSVSPPNIPLSGVRVSILGDANVSTLTNSSGYFSFLNIDRVPLRLLFEKDGFVSDTLPVDWQNKKELSVDRSLKKIPYVNNFSVYSVVENYIYYPNYYWLKITAAFDYEVILDIDSVIISNSELKFREYLYYNSTNNAYERRSDAFRLQKDIEKFVGKSITLSVKTKSGKTYVLATDFLKRIISDQVPFDSPANGDLTGRNPVFKWQKASPGYNFTYSIQVILRTLSTSTTVASADNIPADSTSYSFKDPLPPGEYSWVISCVDEYKNAGWSTSASFRVE